MKLGNNFRKLSINRIRTAVNSFRPEFMIENEENLDVLYENTLKKSGEFRPFSVMEGQFCALKYRYEFALDYLTNDQFHYRDSNYFAFISQSEYGATYEGNTNFRYRNPVAMCARFIGLIDRLSTDIDHVQLTKSQLIEKLISEASEFYSFDQQYQRYIRYHAAVDAEKKKVEVDFLRYFGMRFFRFRLADALMHSHRNKDGTIIIGNGTHRLAVYKVLSDLGLRSNFIYYRRAL